MAVSDNIVNLLTLVIYTDAALRTKIVTVSKHKDTQLFIYWGSRPSEIKLSKTPRPFPLTELNPSNIVLILSLDCGDILSTYFRRERNP